MEKRYKILLSVLVILLGVRLWLPSFLKKTIINAVNETPGYECKIADIDLALYRGALCIDSFQIFITDNNVQEPFVSLPLAEGSIDWPAILDGRIVTKMYVGDAALNFLDGESDEEDQSGGTDWTEPLMDMMPLEINKFEMVNGTVRFQNKDASPPVDMAVTHIDVVLTNISNATGLDGTLPSDLSVSAMLFESGTLDLTGKLNALKEIPDADISLKLDNVQLTKLSEFTKEYGKFDFEQGIFTATSEIAVKNGKIKGYLKPFFDNVKVLKWKEEEGGFLSKVWNGIVGGAFELTENQKKDETATKIVIDGDISSPDVNPLKIVANVFKNAFISAFEKSVDNSIDFGDFGNDTETKDQNFIRELFDGDGNLLNKKNTEKNSN